MRRRTRTGVAFLLGLAAAPAAGAISVLIDLTHPFSAETVYWPTATPFHLTVTSAGTTAEGYYYAANDYSAAEHGGTHVDAPVHFMEGKATVDRIPLERLIAPGALVDASARVGDERDYQVTVADLEAWEAANGRLDDGVILLLRTGWGRFYPDPERYLGTARRGPEAVADLHFPGLHPEAARWLAGSRRIAAVGIDTASIDHGPSRRFEAHQALFREEIPVFENVAALERLPPKGFRVIALPMRIRGGSGAPLRIVAVLEP